MIIRPEHPQDFKEIRTLVTSAFKGAPHSAGTEGAIVDSLRKGNALTVSLVAVQDGEIVGHVAFSPVKIEGTGENWYGLGPVAVHPNQQRKGIGSKLIEAGLEQIKSLSAAGCVVLGDPLYYSRFGFKVDASLSFPDVPAEYFQCLDFVISQRQGVVIYHEAFYGA